jgi:hypothetical protein
MRLFRIITLAFILSFLTYQVCQANQVSDAIKSLKKAYPSFNWQKKSAVVIDINGDGVKDIAVLGYTRDKAAVGIVSGGSSKSFHTKILDFSRGHDYQRGICGRTAKLIVEKTSETPKEALGKYPEGYRICDKCFEISVEDDLCDPITIYWNYKKNELDWWRT